VTVAETWKEMETLVDEGTIHNSLRLLEPDKVFAIRTGQIDWSVQLRGNPFD
jgi:hypothetical protein